MSFIDVLALEEKRRAEVCAAVIEALYAVRGASCYRGMRIFSAPPVEIVGEGNGWAIAEIKGEFKTGRDVPLPFAFRVHFRFSKRTMMWCLAHAELKTTNIVQFFGPASDVDGQDGPIAVRREEERWADWMPLFR